ncbi:MAG: FAD-dependent oxidoreductase, partial [bacterium]
MRKAWCRARRLLAGGREDAKRLFWLVAALSFVFGLGLMTGLDGRPAPAAAEAQLGPVWTVWSQRPQKVLDAQEPSASGAPTADVDVVVFSTQTSGLAAVRELSVAAPHLRVALISAGNLLESPLAQGLGVEDARDIDRVSSGFYQEWRQSVIDYYARRGMKAFNAGGRFVYEPEVAGQALWSYVRGPLARNVLFYSGKLVAASDQSGQPYVDVQIEGGGMLRINTRYFIDASVEADLARMLGADYRIGRHEALYNDVAGVRPVYPGSHNDYETAPQRFSALLTLQVYAKGKAPRISGFAHPNYNPLTYAYLAPLNQRNVTAFASSWTMTIATLPNGKRELNEAWNDWPDVGLAFQWVFSPEKRGDI